MAAKLVPGDRVTIKEKVNGRRLRGKVADFLDMPTPGEEQMIPVIRRKNASWYRRSELRKIPN